MRYGVSGHQSLPTIVTEWAASQLRNLFSSDSDLVGVSSLAEGADQLFASFVLGAGGRLEIVIPCNGYEETFTTAATRRRFDELRHVAQTVIVLPYPAPSEEAFLAAGLVVVERCEHLLAVWDGAQARGLGGTADVVAYARQRHRPVTVLWPHGESRA